jgi:hypothetical protein
LEYGSFNYFQREGTRESESMCVVYAVEKEEIDDVMG